MYYGEKETGEGDRAMSYYDCDPEFKSRCWQNGICGGMSRDFRVSPEFCLSTNFIP